MLSHISSDVKQVLQEIGRSSDQSTANYQDLRNLVQHTIEQNTEVLRQNKQLRQGQEEAKNNQKEILLLQRQHIDRLVVIQQRVDSILVQNYELHEYPIPRRFVILPDSFRRCDPRKVVGERFRLYFLCECGELCSADGDEKQASVGPIPIENQVHLANHDGYELTRPTEFFDRYGPYILGLLRILVHCLTVTATFIPEASLGVNPTQRALQGIESIADKTADAVAKSINFLEKRLEASNSADLIKDTRSIQPGSGIADEISDLKALEGADLRRLDSFLRNKDEDKILGNLYRITTYQGHVKWVCLDHYQDSYRMFVMKTFIHTVEKNGGHFYPQLGRAVITLKSNMVAKEFFQCLADQGTAVEELDVTLDWLFDASELLFIVEMIARSNVAILKLGLMDLAASSFVLKELDPTRIVPLIDFFKKYQHLPKLLSNKKLQGLHLTGAAGFGDFSFSLPKGLEYQSFLRTFRYASPIRKTDWIRLVEIMSSSPGLLDLRLGALPDYTDYSKKIKITTPIKLAMGLSKKAFAIAEKIE
ncbi:hypothetical protein BGX23_003817, partial [Mortierella sp. AD031]